MVYFNINIFNLSRLKFLNKFQQQLVMSFFPTWIASESLFSTVRHRGFRSKRTYFIDDSFLKYNEDFVINYYCQYGPLLDPLIVAR